MAQNFLITSRHGTIFYYRRRVPDDLRKIIGRPYLVKTLATTHRSTALILARAYAVKTDAIYLELRAMKKKNPDGFQVDYSFSIDLSDSGSIRQIRVDAEPGETEEVESLIKTTLQNLPNQTGTCRSSKKSYCVYFTLTSIVTTPSKNHHTIGYLY